MMTNLDDLYGSEPEHPPDIRHETETRLWERVRELEAAMKGETNATTLIDTIDELRLNVVGRDERIAELEERLRALVGDGIGQAGVCDNGCGMYCVYCGVHSADNIHDVVHAATCPIVAGRKTLRETK